MKFFFIPASLFISVFLFGQKKPLDHSVYDQWQQIGEKKISNDGKWIVYSIDVQEGDNLLVIRSADGAYQKAIPRGYNALITEDSRFVICRIKPFYTALRDAKIKKLKPENFPVDSFAVLELGNKQERKVGDVINYKTPDKGIGWVAYQLRKTIPSGENDKGPNKKTTDSLGHIIDSLQQVISQFQKTRKKKSGDEADFPAEGEDRSADEKASDLVLMNLFTGETKQIANVLEYYFNKNGTRLLLETAANPKDSLDKNEVLLYNLNTLVADTLSRGGNDFRNFTMTDDGTKIAYLAERDAAPKALQKFYRIWYYEMGMDSARLLADKNSVGMNLGMTVSEFGKLHFSKSGGRLFFGVAPIQPPKDTALIDIDLVKLDVWNYKDDYLQTVQLKKLEADLQKNYLSIFDINANSIQQLGSEEIPQVIETNEGDGNIFIGISDFGKRIESQWTGATRKDIYAIDVKSGSSKLIKKDLYGQAYPSTTGKLIVWYDSDLKSYFAWNGVNAKNITRNIKAPLYNEENDVPDLPAPYGLMGWANGDSAIYIYDRYDAWKVDLISGNVKCITQQIGRKNKTTFRYVPLDPEKRFFAYTDKILLMAFNETTKGSGLLEMSFSDTGSFRHNFLYGYKEEPYLFGQVSAVGESLDKGEMIFTKENYQHSPDLYLARLLKKDGQSSENNGTAFMAEQQITAINPQQQNYNWGSAGLFQWKAYDGKQSTGILYKPENFDAGKKYPMICYFYERLSNGLHEYIPPSPTPSRLNISFFVSRGYIVFVPDIHYGTGHPGRDAYNYVVSGVRALVKKGFVDSSWVGLQGQSWGGYQVAFLVTATKLFKAAWAGAPVANMTSSYGGIRWETGLSRQFQYEKTQSRIGASLWDKPQLYLENSPLFHLQNESTPLVIMSNDNDGAVPWYQGIELFTAMRRLGKKVWLLNYNGEAHNLAERKNRKDIQVREQQFFDWLLKGEKPAEWITKGIPAVKKGKDWGLQLEE
jgi:dipeptidyl aminopeptidase/acylaminoacyl peptidase